MDVVIANIFDKEKSALGELAFEHEGLFQWRACWSGPRVQKKFVNIPLMPRPPPNSHDHGNCTYGCTPGPAMALLPVGSPAPSVAERSIFPGRGLICHLIAGITLVNPEFSGPLTAADT